MLTRTHSVRTFVLTAGIALAASSAALHAADISPLTTKAAAAAKAGDAAGSIDALEQALAQLRLEAPMTLKPFVVVARPAKFYGDYEARPDATYRKGEKMYFYVEPKNLVYPKADSGIYEPAFEVDVEIKAPGGQSMKQPRFGTFRLPTRSRAQDIYLNLTLSLSDAPPGKYEVRFVVRDLNSKKTATVDQPITLR
jgi:hypothetical protein